MTISNGVVNLENGGKKKKVQHLTANYALATIISHEKLNDTVKKPMKGGSFIYKSGCEWIEIMKREFGFVLEILFSSFLLIYNLKSTLEVDSIAEGCDQASLTEGLRKGLFEKNE